MLFCDNVDDFVRSVGERWSETHPARYVPHTTGPTELGDPIRTIADHLRAGGTPVEKAVCCIPWVSAANLPLGMYPRYMVFMLRATCAALKISRPDLHRALMNGTAATTVVPVVGVRVGMLASLGAPVGFDKAAVGRFMHYDEKRKHLWVKRATSDLGSIAWRAEFELDLAIPKSTVELLFAWARMAPLVACMASTSEYALGPGYSVPFVQRSISSTFRNHLSPEAYAASGVSSALTWDFALQASIGGYPEGAVHAWAGDPLLALCAETRVIDDPAAAEINRARQRTVADKYNKALSRRGSTEPNVEWNAMWAAVRAARSDSVVLDDDTISVATALMSEAAEGDIGPSDSITATQTRAPSRAPSPPPAMTGAAREHIHQILHAAHSSMPQAASVAAGAQDNMSVRW